VGHAAAAARQNGGAAIDVALAQIRAAFGEAAAIDSFKARVEQAFALGPRHAAVQARFGRRAAMLSARDLDAAVVIAERWWRDERKAFQIASALGLASRLSLEVLRELRLILRVMRFKRMHAQFSALVDALGEAATPRAAE
jgi:hypothetical protein